MKRLVFTICLVFISISMLMLFNASYVNARPDVDGPSGSTSEITDADIKKNGLYKILYSCYTDGSSLNKTIDYKKNDITSVIDGKGSIFTGTKNYYMPTGFYSVDPIYCTYQKADLVHGTKKGIINVLSTEAKNGSSKINGADAKDVASRTEYYKGMGYTASYSGGDGQAAASSSKCWVADYSYNSISGTTNKICFTIDKNDKITSISGDGVGAYPSGGKIRVGLKVRLDGREAGDTNYSHSGIDCSSGLCVAAILYVDGSGSAESGISFVEPDNSNSAEGTYADAWDKAQAFYSDNVEMMAKTHNAPSSFKSSIREMPGDSGSGGGAPDALYDTYKISNGNSGYTAAYNYLEGDGAAQANKAFDNTELFYIYTSYLSKKYGLQISYENCEDTDKTDNTDMYLPVVIKNDSNQKVMKYCIVDNWQTANAGNWQTTTVGSDMSDNGKRLPEKIIELLKALAGNVTIARLPANQMSETDQGQASGDDDEDGDSDSKPSCTTNAHELGWILCPIVTGASSFLEQFYENWIEPFLNIDIGLFRFDGNQDSATDDSAIYSQGNIYQVWTAFQGFANLIFVIVFLFVTFSQLTGIGIDNYGIKKILPKLIVCAIMINLSYLICMLAVELSNIIGFAMKGFLKNGPFVPDVSNISIKINQSTPSGETIPTFGTRLAVVGIIAGIAIPYALSVGWAVLIPALILVLSVLLALFFLFAMLGIRQALVVILVCLSPLAFVCYMLPNTKKLYDKWFSVFKAMLIAFPVCSALVYGGDLVAKILVVANQSADNVVSSLGILFTAGIVSIAPVFMIPGLIRKGIEATGAMGAKLTGLQNRARGSMDKGVRNTRLARDLDARQKNLNQFRENRRMRRKAGIDKNGNLTTRGKIQNKLPRTAAGKAHLAQMRQRGFANVSEAMNDDRLVSDVGAAAAGAALVAKQAQTEVDDQITNMATETGNYNVDMMETQLATLMSQDTLTATDKTKAKALMKKLSQSGGDGNKRLISIMSGQSKNASGNAVAPTKAASSLFSDYATSTDIANSIGNKDAYMAQYLRDNQASFAQGGQGVGSFDDWLVAEREVGGVKTTNAEFVAKKQLDDDEKLMQQSGTSLERTAHIDDGEIVGANGKIRTDVSPERTLSGYALSGERANRIMENDNIMKKDDQRTTLEGVLDRATDPARSRDDTSGPARPTPPAPSTPAPSGPAPSAPAPTRTPAPTHTPAPSNPAPTRRTTQWSRFTPNNTNGGSGPRPNPSGSRRHRS